jgi:hypothetical protein
MRKINLIKVGWFSKKIYKRARTAFDLGFDESASARKKFYEAQHFARRAVWLQSQF